MDIFISYRQEDSQWPADRLYKKIVKRFRGTGSEVFLDVDGIPLGNNFVKEIEERVSRCDILLVLIGSAWLDVRDAETGERRINMENDPVRFEISTALEMGKKVIPIYLDDAPPPPADALPDEIKALSFTNGVSVRRLTFEADTDRLLEGLVQEDYDIPSMLLIHRYDDPDEDGFFPYSSLRVLTIRALGNESFTLRIPRRSLNIVEHERSISDDVDTRISGLGTNAAQSEREYTNNYFHKQYLNVSEARWKTRIGIRSEPNPDDVVQRILFERFLQTDFHDYMGTRIVRHTSYFRQLIYFPEKEFLPRKPKMVQIFDSGEYREQQPRVEYVEEECLVVLEVDNLLGNSGVYTYWKWDEAVLKTIGY
ncbi:MAG: toll/interleukin-1 receptor domain-containing protein [Verrucomicrobiota bacterium]